MNLEFLLFIKKTLRRISDLKNILKMTLFNIHYYIVNFHLIKNTLSFIVKIDPKKMKRILKFYIFMTCKIKIG